MLYIKVVTAPPNPRMVAAQLGPFVLVHPNWSRSNEALVHEEQHVRQWYLISALFLPVLAALFWPATPLALFAHMLMQMSSRTIVAFFEADAFAAEVRHGRPLPEAVTDFRLYRFGWPDCRTRRVVDQLSR